MAQQADMILAMLETMREQMARQDEMMKHLQEQNLLLSQGQDPPVSVGDRRVKENSRPINHKDAQGFWHQRAYTNSLGGPTGGQILSFARI